MQDVNEHDHQTPDGNRLSLFHVWNLLNKIEARLEELERKQSEALTAFVINDLQKPDLDGHRKHHLQLNKTAEIVDGYKYDMTKRVLTVIGGGLLTLIGKALYERYFS